ncbi:MAG: hypothetical protein HKM95_15395, partial [Inquilinus sp.]|nr:hypothetical protein [Inquilinus sp.]
MSESAGFDLARPARSVTGMAVGFFSWWTRELAACVPARLRNRLGGKRGTLVFSLRSGEVGLAYRKQGRTTHVGCVPLDPERPEAARQAVAECLAAARVGSAEIVLLLPEDQTLRRPVDLPLAARENLREVLAFEMDRLTPFAADGIEFDARPTGSDSEAQTLTVELAVAPREIVDRAIAAVRSWGKVPDIVGFSDDPDTPERKDTFVFRRRDAGQGRLSRRLAAGFWIATAALALALTLVPLERKQELLAVYEADLAERRAEAAAVDSLRRQVSEMAEVSDRLWREKTMRPATIVLVDEVTRL